ncbi:MAG: aspartate dehydrogenase [Lachnospiraceae bacterium]|nr:aspartate dehydrogenase [Lachnospiraceae bacterium]
MIFRKNRKTEIPVYDYDPERDRPLIRASICNGEQVAGFKDRNTGIFHEIMFIKDEADKQQFMEQYGLTHIDKEY